MPKKRIYIVVGVNYPEEEEGEYTTTSEKKAIEMFKKDCGEYDEYEVEVSEE